MSLTLFARAKINLTLEVLRKRDDGYHEIATVLQMISLADTLEFEESEVLGLECSEPSLQSADNLVVKAARALKDETGCEKGATIRLTKRIPTAAGLGSGATDAASTLVGLNQLWGLQLTSERLMELAARLGSDVAALVMGGTVLAEGRGERVTPLPAAPDLSIVLAMPTIAPVENKTAQMYARLNSSHFTSGRDTEGIVDRIRGSKEIDPTILFNVFEQVAFDFFPGLSEYRSRLLKAGAGSVHVAGAGPALFALMSDRAQGAAVVEKLQAQGMEVYLVNTSDPAAHPSPGDARC